MRLCCWAGVLLLLMLGVVGTVAAQTPTPDYSRVYDIAWHPDGTSFAVATDTGTWFYDANGEWVTFMPESGLELHWNESGDQLVLMSGGFRIFRYPTRSIVYAFERLSAGSVSDWNTARGLLALRYGNGIEIYDTNTGIFVETVLEEEVVVASDIQWNRNGNVIAVAGAPPNVYLWDFDNHLGSTLLEIDAIPTAIEWSTDDSQLAIGVDRDIYIWDFQHNSVNHMLIGHEAEVLNMDWGSGGLASVARDGTLKIWDVQKEIALQTIELSGFSNLVEWSPDGQTLLYVDDNEVILIPIPQDTP